RGHPGLSRRGGDRSGIRRRGFSRVGRGSPSNQARAAEHDRPRRVHGEAVAQGEGVSFSRHCVQMNMKILVRKKSAMRMVIEMTPTERVAQGPPPSVPPVVIRPK